MNDELIILIHSSGISEKIGIVGRTGKITLSLFRLIEPSKGTISIDYNICDLPKDFTNVA
uniref:Uncharacterized protein n=1 Tax=Tetranychus urticae TaxID=32264 RepID=T1K3R8_TETUR